MIGLIRPHDRNDERVNEPQEIRDLTKTKLYENLCEQWLLPPKESKGVNRNYLVNVFRNQVYRVPLMDFKRFEVELTPMQMKRNNLVNLTYIMRKLNRLLEEREQRPLGFGEFVVPDENWLVKVARWADRSNLLEFFQMPVTRAPNQGIIYSDRVHCARKGAHNFVFRDQHQLLENKKVFEGVKLISEVQRKIVSYQIEIEEMENLIQQIRDKINEQDGILRSSLAATATHLVSLAEPNFRPEEAFDTENMDHDRYRGQILRLTVL